VQRKDVSARELTEAAIARIETLNPRLNAVVTKLYDQALEAIRSGLPTGPLTGVPFLLKDINASMKGVPTSGGSGPFAKIPAPHDSETVIRYRKAGLTILGKTNTPELGLNLSTEPELFGPTRNPWSLEHSAGGSSGGSAAAVASGMVPVAHASDGGGSIRIPASCCGLFGLKPTRGRISAGPDAGEGWGGLSTQHVVSRSVRDSALFLDFSAGPSVGDPYWAEPSQTTFLEATKRDPRRLKIAVSFKTPNEVPIDPACIAATRATARLCESLGHSVEEAYPTYAFEDMRLAAATVICGNIAARLDKLALARGKDIAEEEVEPLTWICYQGGKLATAANYATGMQTLHRTGREVAPFFETYDVLLTPVLAKPPIKLGVANTQSKNTEEFIEVVKTYSPFCQLFNVTGQPAMSVPLHWTEDGVPIGLHFAARYGAEAVLFSLAAQLERAKPWAAKRPPLFA
jgi:Asp-tRNA(Asn)/Glu-tRNA(Gln) amidotransferase A subunit family amidase